MLAGYRAIGCKWVFKIKHHLNDTIEWYEARLVAKAFTQREGIDYEETLSPVAKLIIVRYLLTIIVVRHWPLHHMDVQNVFLHGDLFLVIVDRGGVLCVDSKSLFMNLNKHQATIFVFFAIHDIRFTHTQADYSLFNKVFNISIIIILLYVDDMIITGNNDRTINDLKQCFSHCFQIKDLRPLKYFLGVEVARSKAGTVISQHKYTLDILEEAGLLGAKPSKVPMEHDLILLPTNSDLLKDSTQ